MRLGEPQFARKLTSSLAGTVEMSNHLQRISIDCMAANEWDIALA